MKHPFPLILIIAFTVFQSGCSSSQNAAEPEASLLCKIAVHGSEPHTYTGCTTPERKHYRITGELEAELRRTSQNKTIRLRGKILSEPGPGIPGEFHAEKMLQES